MNKIAWYERWGGKRRFNRRKTEILGLLNKTGKATARRVSSELGISHVTASRLLGHYSRQGLLGRRTIDRFGTKCYSLTEKGRERLRWLKETNRLGEG